MQKPATREYFHYVNSNLHKLRAVCIDCVCQYAREQEQKNNSKLETPPGAKFSLLSIFCKRCNRHTPYWFMANRSSSECRACASIRKNPQIDRKVAFDEFRENLMRLTQSRFLRKWYSKNKCINCEIIHDVRQDNFTHLCLNCKAKTLQDRNAKRDKKVENEKQKIKQAGGKKAYEQKQRQKALVLLHKKLLLLKNKKIREIPRQGMVGGICWLWNNPTLSNSEAYKLRYKLDTEFNLKERIRRQFNKKRKCDGIGDLMREALKRGGTSNQVQTLLGYKISDLRAHLESKFTKGMTWEMFCLGKIHIDHIRPQSSFDLSKPQEWTECWSLDNLQPLWAKDNLTKSNKFA